MKRYISVDVELSGRDIRNNSMLFLGACVVGKLEESFYREIKPVTFNFERNAMRIASQGLNCLTPKLRKYPQYDPAHANFNPIFILKLLYREGINPKNVMQDFENWIHKVSELYEPVIVAKPIRVDFSVLQHYFRNFLLSDGPFSENNLFDLEFEYKEAIDHSHGSVSLRKLGLMDMRFQRHNALDDAVFQAQQCEKVLSLKFGNGSRLHPK